MPELKIEYWPIERLIFYARNPRKNEHAVPKMASLIKEFGFKVPVVARSDGSLVDGHLRLRAAQYLGMETVPVVLADEWTEAQVKAFRIAVNKSAELAEWQPSLLALEIEDLQELDFDLELTGFDLPELDEIIGGGMQDGTSSGLTDPDSTPDVQAEVVTRLGDVWILGNHRLMCGDSTDAGNITLLMGGEKADLVFTSPPYNASASSIGPGKKFGDRRPDVKMYGENVTDAKTSDEYVDFAKSVLKNCLDFTDGMVYWNVNYNSNSKFEYIAQIVDYLDMLVDQVCWKKHLTITNTGGGYTRIWEPIYVFSTLKTPLRLREVAMNFWEVDNVGATVGDHHACFPVALPLKALDLYGDQIKTVLEPFCGAGSTLIACEQRGVACRGMELEPRFCDVIVRRWQEFTGQEATLEEDGRTFAAVQEERGG